jgi:hypothetical protein
MTTLQQLSQKRPFSAGVIFSKSAWQGLDKRGSSMDGRFDQMYGVADMKRAPVSLNKVKGENSPDCSGTL